MRHNRTEIEMPIRGLIKRYLLSAITAAACLTSTLLTANEYHELTSEDGKKVNLFIETPLQTTSEVIDGKLIIKLTGNDDLADRQIVNVAAQVIVQFMPECASFVDGLKSDAGTSKITEFYKSPLECSIKTTMDAKWLGLGFVDANWIWSLECKCYVAISVSGESEAKEISAYFAESLVRSVRNQLINSLRDDVLRIQFGWWSSWRSEKILPVSVTTVDAAKANLADLVARNTELVKEFPTAVDHKDALISTRRSAIETAAAASRLEELKQQESRRKNELAQQRRLEKDVASLTAVKPKSPEATASDSSDSQVRAEPKRPPDPNRLIFTLKNSTEKTLLVRFFNLGFSNKGPPKGYWPTSTRAYVLQNDGKDDYHLTCKKGEQICYGAHIDGHKYINEHHIYWGAALEGDKGCTTCCGICGSLYAPINLTLGSIPPPPAKVSRAPDPPSRDNNGSELGDALGLAIGVMGAIGGVRNQTPTYNYSPAPPPRGPNHRQSGISR